MHDRTVRDKHVRFRVWEGDVSCCIRSASSRSVQLHVGLSAGETVLVPRWLHGYPDFLSQVWSDALAEWLTVDVKLGKCEQIIPVPKGDCNA